MSKDTFGEDYKTIQETVVKEQEVIPSDYIDDRGYHIFEVAVEPVEMLVNVTIIPELPSAELKRGIADAVTKVSSVFRHTVKWVDDATLEVWVNVNPRADLKRINEDIDDAVIGYLDNVEHEGQD